VHGSRSATSRAFSAHLERGIWHCFVCAASGNALDLWAQVTQQEIYPAVLDLYCRLGRTAPRSSPRPKEKQAMPDP
jgi:DNA primase